MIDVRTVDWRRGRGLATADIHVEIDGTPFPFPGWNDFAVAIARSFVLACVALLRGDTQEERVEFMEGPHAIRLRCLTDSTWQLRSETESTTGDRSSAWMKIDRNAFVASVRDGGRSLVLAPRPKEASREVEGLADALRELLSLPSADDPLLA